MNRQEISELVKRVHEMPKDKSTKLPNNSYFLGFDNVVCFPNSYGDSRYPYECDGLTLFAHSDGFIDCVESTLNVFRPVHGGLEENSLSLYGGEYNGKDYTPISITGAAAQLSEEISERYCVFTPACAYYITETEKAIYAARIYVDREKNIRISLGALNKAETRDIYLCAYMEPTLSEKMFDGIFWRMPRYAELFENGNYILNAKQGKYMNYMNINLEINGNLKKRYSSVAKNSFMCKRGAGPSNALSLKTGKFLHEVKRLNTVDWTVAADMLHFELPQDGYVGMEYMLTLSLDENVAKANIDKPVNSQSADEKLIAEQAKQREIYAKTKFNFVGDWKGEKVHSNTVNSFLRCVQRQASLCALGKNYVGKFLGIRDVFQQLETALIWQPKEARAQIVRVMDYILEDGRPPREISFPVGDEVPELHIQPYIDQGFWIISTLHTYLAYTGDYSILDEICGYYKTEKTFGPATRTDIKDSILCHLMKITDFLISNVDDKTNCLHILFGDWNDAVDGLGRSKDPNKEFGNGCGMMVTFQLYLLLNQMIEIIENTTKDETLIKKYTDVKQRLVKGITDNAIVENENGFKRIMHGWGEDQSYYVGTFKDFDGISRISLTSNAFAANSGMIYEFPELKDDIAKNVLDTDSKFGFLTFDKSFAPETADKIGRIAAITPGTYENNCPYVHAGVFGIMSLFILGYAKEAWHMLEKTMVISHENVTLTSFVMPNSYCYDEYYGFNGESMGDWYTGSGTAMLKGIIKYAFGIEPCLNTVRIAPADYFPTENAEITLNINGKKVDFSYEKQGVEMRKIILNGNEMPLLFDEVRGIYYAELNKSLLEEENTIKVID